MMCRSSHFSVVYRPASQMVTCPPPYSPAAIVAAERRVLQRVVLGRDGEPVGPGARRRPLGHRPALQDAVALQPQVPVHPLAGARRGACGAPGRRTCRRRPPGAAARPAGPARRSARGSRLARYSASGSPAGARPRGHVRRCGGRAWPAACRAAFFAAVVLAAVALAGAAFFAAAPSPAAFLRAAFFAGAFLAGAFVGGGLLRRGPLGGGLSSSPASSAGPAAGPLDAAAQGAHQVDDGGAVVGHLGHLLHLAAALLGLQQRGHGLAVVVGELARRRTRRSSRRSAPRPSSVPAAGR